MQNEVERLDQSRGSLSQPDYRVPCNLKYFVESVSEKFDLVTVLGNCPPTRDIIVQDQYSRQESSAICVMRAEGHQP